MHHPLRTHARHRPSLLVGIVAVGVAAASCGHGGSARTVASTLRPAVTSTLPVPTTARPTTTMRRLRTTTTPAPTTTTVAPPATPVLPPPSAPPPVAAPATAPPVTAPTRLIDQIADTGGATKVITVDSPSWASTTATFMGWEQRGGGWVLVHGPWTANVGWPGWSWTPGEANGFSPIGSFTFGVGFGTHGNPGYGLGWFDITPTDYWVEDPKAGPAYNTHQQGPADEAKAPWQHFERLLDTADAYEYAALINFNVPVSGSGRGSGIFLHEETGGPTAGCVSLPRDQLVATLRWIDAGTRIIMGPDDTIRTL